MCDRTQVYVSSYFCVCVLMLLCMCPHAIVYVSCYVCECPHTTCVPNACDRTRVYARHTPIYLSSYYYYICVLILLLYMQVGNRSQSGDSSGAQRYICVLILRYIGPHYMCPHTTMCPTTIYASSLYASSYYYIGVLIIYVS